MNLRVSGFLALTVVLLLAFTCASVKGDSEVLPWSVERIYAQCVWDNNLDMTVDEGANAGEYVSIAVIDTGIDYYISYGQKVYHPDLAANVAGGARFRYWGGEVEVVEDNQYEDEEGHGTHAAGTIAAVDNNEGVIGTAPKATIYALKIVALTSEGYAKTTATAINWAVQKGICIISMSLGCTQDYEVLHTACDNAYGKALLIAGAGNDNGPLLYPAAYDSVIAVGAVYPNDTRWEWSNTGDLDFVAPGVNINSTWLWSDPNQDDYLVSTGTSMAVPHVTGTAALIFASKSDPDYDQNNNGWEPPEVCEKLRNTSLDLGEVGKDVYYGYGLVNAWYASQRPPGDVNNDNFVNVKDAVLVGAAFGSKLGDPNWDPRADIIIDNHVNVKDTVIVEAHFGEIDP